MLVTKRKHAHQTKKSGFFGISRYSGISNIRYFELISRSPASSK